MQIVKPNWQWKEARIPLDLDQVDGIALHHMDHPTADIWDVESWHLGFGWIGIGYNWWIAKDGTIYEGRGFYQGAGVKNHNGHLISIGFQGGYHPSDKFECDTVMPDTQLQAGLWLVGWLKSQVPTIVTVAGHGHWMPTDCPGMYFPIDKFFWMKGDVPQMLKIGSVGTEVTYLQEQLNVVGYQLAVDGQFGPATEAAVKSFQYGNGLTVDGIVGPATQAALDAMVEKVRKPPDIDYKAKYERLVQGIKNLIGG